MNIAEKLRKLRDLRGLTTVELARTSGVHQTTISAIENGKHSSPGIDTIERLSQALKISPLYFFNERVRTPFDLTENLPPELADFLLRDESLPYLLLSRKACEEGVSCSTIEQLLKVMKDNYGQMTGEAKAKKPSATTKNKVVVRKLR
jgi:transcriptional regulator with XRE-family HTH domain